MNTRQNRGRPPAALDRLPLLDRLLDDAPDAAQDPPASRTDVMETLRRGVRRDLEALLNARRRWRSWPDRFAELAVSPVGYGLSDFAAGAFNDPRQRDLLRARVEQTIRRFEPRLSNVRVTLVEGDTLTATLHLRIGGLLLAEPGPEPIVFNTVVDAATTQVVVQAGAADRSSPADDV